MMHRIRTHFDSRHYCSVLQGAQKRAALDEVLPSLSVKMVILEEKQSRRVVKPLNGILVKYRGCPARDEDDRLESARAILPDIFRQASLLRQQKQKNVRFLPETNSDDAGKLYGAVFKFSRSAAQKRKPDSVPVTVLQMKDFFCLLGKFLIAIVLYARA